MNSSMTSLSLSPPTTSGDVIFTPNQQQPITSHCSGFDDYHYVTPELPPTPESIYDIEAPKPTPMSSTGPHGFSSVFKSAQDTLHTPMTSTQFIPGSWGPAIYAQGPMPTRGDSMTSSFDNSFRSDPTPIERASDKDISSIVSIVDSLMNDVPDDVTCYPMTSDHQQRFPHSDPFDFEAFEPQLKCPKVEPSQVGCYGFMPPMTSAQCSALQYSQAGTSMSPAVHIKQEPGLQASACHVTSQNTLADFESSFAFKIPQIKTESQDLKPFNAAHRFVQHQHSTPQTSCTPPPPTPCRSISAPEVATQPGGGSNMYDIFGGFTAAMTPVDDLDFEVKPGSTFQEMCEASGVMNGKLHVLYKQYYCSK